MIAKTGTITRASYVRDPIVNADWDHWKPKRAYDRMFARYLKAKPGSDLARYCLWWLARWPTC